MRVQLNSDHWSLLAGFVLATKRRRPCGLTVERAWSTFDGTNHARSNVPCSGSIQDVEQVEVVTRSEGAVAYLRSERALGRRCSRDAAALDLHRERLLLAPTCEDQIHALVIDKARGDVQLQITRADAGGGDEVLHGLAEATRIAVIEGHGATLAPRRRVTAGDVDQSR
jgi:hypothetical protein